MKKRVWVSIVFLLAFSVSIFGYPGDTLTIQIKSKGKKTYPVFNGKQFRNGCSARLKRILGQPYEIVIIPNIYSRFSRNCRIGPGSHWRSISFNYFHKGLEFSGRRRTKLNELFIDVDTLKKYSKKHVVIEVAGLRFGSDSLKPILDSVKVLGDSAKSLFPFSYLVSDSIQKIESHTTPPLFRVILLKERILLLSSGREIMMWFDMKFHLKRMKIEILP